MYRTGFPWGFPAEFRFAKIPRNRNERNPRVSRNKRLMSRNCHFRKTIRRNHTKSCISKKMNPSDDWKDIIFLKKGSFHAFVAKYKIFFFCFELTIFRLLFVLQWCRFETDFGIFSVSSKRIFIYFLFTQWFVKKVQFLYCFAKWFETEFSMFSILSKKI